MAARPYDAVIFGATGFTGLQTVKHVAEAGAFKRWAVGGRSADKLQRIAAKHECGVLVADVSDHAALVAMARSARVVLNETGPYRFFGEAVVKACIEAGTDYVDLCGEPEFMERMLLEHGDRARQAGVVICHACAFDSVPADMGIMHCAQLFASAGGECTQVELFHTLDAPFGYSGHVTTFQAAVHGVGAVKQLAAVRRSLEEKHGKILSGSAAAKPKLQRGQYFYEPRLSRYAVPFIGSDASVVRSSRRTLINIMQKAGYEKKAPHFGIYFCMKSRLSLFKMFLGGLIFQLLAGRSWGRSLLLKYPGMFTFGSFSDEGPSAHQMQNNSWTGYFFAKGVMADGAKQLEMRASLPDPGYIGTSMLIATVAETILAERSSLPGGGVFTPAALLCESTLLKRLAAKGFIFETTKSDLP